MSESRISLKDPWIAAVLAYLMPGAGHLYQGRTFKGLLYFVCILGTFFYGMRLGDWKVVYYQNEPGHKTYGYYSQVLVGLPALPALVQSKRFQNRKNVAQTGLDRPLSSSFEGTIRQSRDPEEGTVVGAIQLETVPGDFGPEVRGSFDGTLAESGEPIELHLAGPIFLERKVGPSSRRSLNVNIVSPRDERGELIGRMEGTIPRSFFNWFQAPLDDKTRGDLHGTLGKRFELAVIYTWIAGLLNILAIWDAFEGPAYGYGDEEDEDEDSEKKGEKQDGDESSPSKTDSSAAVSESAQVSKK